MISRRLMYWAGEKSISVFSDSGSGLLHSGLSWPGEARRRRGRALPARCASAPCDPSRPRGGAAKQDAKGSHATMSTATKNQALVPTGGRSARRARQVAEAEAVRAAEASY